MPAISKEFRQLRSNVPNDSKLLFGDDIIQRIMSISKASKSVVKYQSQSRHHAKYSRPSKSYNYHQKPVQKIQILPENIKQSFWKEEQRAVLPKEILGVRLSNLNIKDLSQKVEKFKAGNIKNYYNIWAKITSDHFILERTVKNGLKVNLNNKMVGNSPHLYNPKMKEVLVINSKEEKLLKKELL